ncbi:MAG: pyridoxal phosphate-dependent aminotransferase [Halanaerobiales bacterium]
MNITERLDSPSIFIGKQSEDIISFGSGQPDLPPPVEAIEGLDIRSDLRYGLIQGEIELRQGLAGEYPRSSAENFVITNGASEALDLIFRAMDNGKVLLPKPYYYSYPHILKYADMEPVYTELQDGRIDINDFKEKIKGCKAVLINSPSNPTGRVENIETLKQIEAITRELGIYVISDEVYKDIIYDRENYILKGEHVITVNSFSKTYAMCGVRVGYLWSLDQDFVDKVIEIKTHSSMNTNLVGQDMALKAMKAPEVYIEEQLRIWYKRRDLIYEGLKELGFDLWKPEGAFYVLPALPLDLRGISTKEFVWNLYKEYKVIVYLGDWFGAPARIRLSYALCEKQMKEGLNRIRQCINSLVKL